MKRVIVALAAAVLTAGQFGCCATHCDAPRCCKPFACGLFGNWGCGGIYRGDWHSVPPDYCTHCDHYGNVTRAGYGGHDNGYYDEVSYAGGGGEPVIPEGYEVIDDRMVTPQEPTPAEPPPPPTRPTSRVRQTSRGRR